MGAKPTTAVPRPHPYRCVRSASDAHDDAERAATKLFAASGSDAVETRADLDRALAVLWAAVHRRMEAVRARLNSAPPRRVIDEWCCCLNGYGAIAQLAALLDVRPQVPDELRDGAPSWMP